MNTIHKQRCSISTEVTFSANDKSIQSGLERTLTNYKWFRTARSIQQNLARYASPQLGVFSSSCGDNVLGLEIDKLHSTELNHSLDAVNCPVIVLVLSEFSAFERGMSDRIVRVLLQAFGSRSLSLPPSTSLLVLYW